MYKNPCKILADILLNLRHQVRKDLPGGFHVSGFSSLGKSILSWLVVSTNKAIIRNLPLTLQNIAESAAKEIASQ